MSTKTIVTVQFEVRDAQPYSNEMTAAEIQKQAAQGQAGHRGGKLTMKERPVLMSAPMVRATLRDVDPKTQTRRIIKPQPDSFTVRGAFHEIVSARKVHICPHGKPGDRLWVRETWAWPGEEQFIYRADQWAVDMVEKWKTDPNYPQVKWKPSIHMPRRATRITLEVSGVRVERLQDISEEDARAEGVERISDRCFNATDIELLCGATARQGFEALWRYINGPESWAANPYVWVIEFKRIDQKDPRP